jgi:hypothetical protein
MYAYLATVNATDAGARAINYAFESANLSFLINAVQYAYSNGVFIAAAAGNNGNSTPVYPAYYPEIMAVGGRDSSDGRYSSSSYGDWVDISAPAVNLFSTNKNNGYKYGTGTSYAAPQVTGLVGLILSKNPTLTNVQVRQIINDSADYIATDYWVGGRINVTRALQMTPNPPVNNAPVLAAIGNKNVNEGNGLIIDVNATDADNDTLTYYTSASFGSFNSATGVFNWTPGYNDAGIYQVTFNVTDGFLWDSETINITVNNVNRAPVLDFISDKNVNENQIVTIIANATDPDSDLLSYAINDSRFVQNGNTFTWQTNYNSAGIYYVLVSVSDGNGGSDDQVVQVTVNNVQYMLYVNKGGTGSGTVTSIPAGINCGSDCDENYDAGIDVNLTANTAPGSKFMGWSGDCSGNGECIVNIDSISYVSANFALLNLVKDDTEDASSCSGNCHPSWTRGLDENWGSVAADAGNCSGEGRCTPNGVGTGIVEEYNWTNNFLNGNVTLESKYEIRASGRYNVSCYNGASWQELFSDSGTRWPYIITHNITVPSACIITNNPLKIKHTIFGIHPMAPTFYYESRIWYYSL